MSAPEQHERNAAAVGLGLLGMVVGPGAGGYFVGRAATTGQGMSTAIVLWAVGFVLVFASLAVRRAAPASPVRSTARVAWAATHAVPVGGIQAFGRRDPYAECVVIPEHTQLRLDETLGAWGKVTNANGVSRWVNAEILIPLNAAPSIRCPFCAELIQSQAIVCRWCGRDLPGRGSAEPPPPPAP